MYNLIDPVDKNFLGSALYFDEAQEPSNIMWENLRFTVWHHHFFTVIAWIAIFIFITCMFLFFVWLEKLTVLSQGKYPPTLNCDPIIA